MTWDVHRLVELSREFPRFEISLCELPDFESRSWFTDSDCAPTHKDVAMHAKLIEESDMSFPIILGEDGRVMDGMHRICKAWIRGETAITAVQFISDPEPDYIDVDTESLPYDEPW